MMAARKTTPEDNDAFFSRSIRDDAEKKLAHSKKIQSGLSGQTPEELIHELQVHQIELETQAEELRKANLALEESRGSYLDLYDFAPAGYLTLDDKALIKEVNLTCALMLGIVRRRLIKARFRRFIVPKDQDHWDRYSMSVLTSGEKQTFDIELVHSDGSVFPVRLDCIRVKKNTERPTIRITIIDITRQKEAEAAIRESEERFWYLFSEIPLPYQSLDAEGRILEVSPRWLDILGYSRNEVIWRPFWDFLAPESQERFRTVFGKFKESGAVNNEEFLMKKKDGSDLIVSYTGRIGRNPNGSIRQTYCILTDITGQKELEKERERHAQELMQYSGVLDATNKKLNLLSGITRHDITNQLTVLVGYLRILEKKQTDPSLAQHFQQINSAAQRISAMIQFTREYEKIGVNAPAWQDCRDLVGTAAKEILPGKVTVKNDIPAGHEVLADPLIGKVFYNLMDNAIRYGQKITTIRFSGQESGDYFLIVCEDDGDGVPDTDKERIFDRGFGKNTGLGLALSREIFSITGITIRENGEPGKGARFEMIVPKGAWRFMVKNSPATVSPMSNRDT